jgi:biotin carboxylase
VAPPEDVRDELMRGYCAAETAHVLDDLWHALPCAWVPGPPAAIRRAEYKFTQLGAAHRAGFEAPDTLTTNDPEAFFAFRADHPGAMIAKPAGPSMLRQPGQPNAGYMKASGYTALVSRGDLGYASALRRAPVTFQPYVEKRSEIRATVIGDRVLAVEIDSQANHRTRIDWRRYDRAHTPYRAHRLPEAIERSCLALARRLGLRYGAIDLILTPEGRYVFLEINPNGQFGWLEESAGLPLHDALCDLLVGLDARPGDGGL